MSFSSVQLGLGKWRVPRYVKGKGTWGRVWRTFPPYVAKQFVEVQVQVVHVPTSHPGPNKAISKGGTRTGEIKEFF